MRRRSEKYSKYAHWIGLYPSFHLNWVLGPFVHGRLQNLETREVTFAHVITPLNYLVTLLSNVLLRCRLGSARLALTADIFKLFGHFALPLQFQKINEKPQVVNEYESGKAIPNNQVMSKLERALGKASQNPRSSCRIMTWVSSVCKSLIIVSQPSQGKPTI